MVNFKIGISCQHVINVEQKENETVMTGFTADGCSIH